MENQIKKPVIPIAFAANDAFAPIFAACLRSIMDHSSARYVYDIILIHSDITEENQTILLKMVAEKPGFSLRFFNAAHYIERYTLKDNGHISNETYYRFLIQELLPEYDKVLYLDCDLIALADVAALYHTDIKGYLLAAARDPDFLGQVNGANPETRKYVKTKFPMKHPYRYFQAGVLLLNTKELRKSYSFNDWLSLAANYNDQDILNLYCEGRVKYLNMAWNLLTDCDHKRVHQTIAFAPAAIQKEYFTARANPKIIHYAGYLKPWHDPEEDFASYFWEAAAKTPYFDTLFQQLLARVSAKAVKNAKIKTKLVAKAEAPLKPIADLFFPLHTRRREALKWLLGK